MNFGRARALLGVLLLELAWSMSYLFISFEAYSESGFMEYALIRGIPSLALFFGSRFYGFVSDSTGLRRPFFLLGSLSTIIALAIMPLIPLNWWLFVITLWYFLSAYEPVMIAYLSSDELKGIASGEYYLSSELGFTIGTAIGGILTDSLGIKNVLFIASLIAAPSVFLFWGVRDSPKDSKLNIKEAIRRTLTMEFPGKTRYIVPFLFLASLSISTFYAAFSIKVFEKSHRSNTLIGLLISGAGLFGAIFGPLYGKLVDRIGGAMSFTLSCFIYSIYFLLGAETQDLFGLALLMVLPLFPLHYASRNTFAMELAPEESASAVSVPSSLGSISDAIGNYLGGVSLGIIGITWTILLSAATSLSVGLATIARFRSQGVKSGS